MAHAQRCAFTAVASLMALSPLASPVLAGDTSPTLRPPRAAASTVTCPVPAPPPPNPNALWNLGKLWPTRLRTPKNVSTVQSDPFFVL
jgi:hypothetical protein